MNVLIPIADGSESLETVTLTNVLRRGGLSVTLAAIGRKTEVNGTRDIGLRADTLFDAVSDRDFDAIVLPGGEAGASALGAHPALVEKLHAQRLAHRWFGGICAAPALALAPHGLLDGKQATCYPAFRDKLLHWVDQPVVADGHCLTSQGPATAIAFGLALIEKLAGHNTRQRVAADLLAES
ncbi:DJ-1 family glyoxalase III [Solimonas terrae]|uniref:DJ-1/PfpI family protein n=1 Tax=Solimonas terrae TaxID=1396819 RepID=A0A6M2BN28_9GAMM|nr:DJ-1 family glyoxalase III [Solimonas terrae]NGY03499.1 DJ-1/PfpI family protein [Solimonas terrae]